MTFITQELWSKEQFLIEHNKLSPVHLQATSALLTQFQEEQRPLLKEGNWSFKLRASFISWLLLLPLAPQKKKYIRKSKKSIYKIYPYAES